VVGRCAVDYETAPEKSSDMVGLDFGRYRRTATRKGSPIVSSEDDSLAAELAG